MSSKLEENLPLPNDRRIIFSKDVDAESMGKLTDKILSVNQEDEYLEKLYNINDLKYSRKPIEIYIDSYGGYVYQCFGVLSVMEKSKTPIHTIATGAAMSCGFLILIHGHKRFAYENATPMYHQVSAGAWGKVKEMEESMEETKRLQIKIEKMTRSKTKITKEQLEKNYKSKKNWFMTSDEAKKLGVIDEII